jgi:putative redox protein
MMATIEVSLQQMSSTATQATIRTHTVTIDRPIAKGGSDQGAMGGELLLASLGGCFMSNLLEIIRTREANIHNIHLKIHGTLDSSPSRFSAIALHLTADYGDADEIEKFVTMAERGCIVANTLRPSVQLTFQIEPLVTP